MRLSEERIREIEHLRHPETRAGFKAYIALKDLLQERDELVTIAEAGEIFYKRVEEIDTSKEFQSVFTIAAVHQCEYQGKTWDKEQKAMSQALQAWSPTPGKEE